MPETIETAIPDLAAALSLGFLAARFAVQPETWPVFVAWCQTLPHGEFMAEMHREYAADLAGQLGIGVDIALRVVQLIPG
jgi:hypothetical protein